RPKITLRFLRQRRQGMLQVISQKAIDGGRNRIGKFGTRLVQFFKVQLFSGCDNPREPFKKVSHTARSDFLVELFQVFGRAQVGLQALSQALFCSSTYVLNEGFNWDNLNAVLFPRWTIAVIDLNKFSFPYGTNKLHRRT